MYDLRLANLILTLSIYSALVVMYLALFKNDHP